MIRVASALSTLKDSVDAATEAAERVEAGLGGVHPHLVLCFVSPHHVALGQTASEVVRMKLEPRHLVGCSAEWVVGGSREVEDEPAVSLWAAVLPDVTVEPFRMRLVRSDEGTAIVGFPDLEAEPEIVLLLSDPFSFPTDALLQHAGTRHPGLRFIGGVASGGGAPGDHRLFLDANVFDVGAVGVTLSGRVRVETIVSQGCRPVGRSYVVTRSDGNTIEELGSRPALDVVRDTFAEASVREQRLMQQGLHVGIVIDEYKEDFGRGDFLVRNVIGADQNSGAIAIGEPVQIGQTVQFHVRDAESADEDLRLLLESASSRQEGALLFTCNGRGSRLFGIPDHDAAMVSRVAGNVAGMFCNGEVGPIGPRSFLHGFTASVALFSDPHHDG